MIKDEQDERSEGFGFMIGNRPAVKSAGRSLEVFQFFAQERRPAKASEIARRLGIPSSSTSFLLRTLLELDYLVLDEDTRTYFPSARFFLLGAWMFDAVVVPAEVCDLAKRLSIEAGETTILAMESGCSVVYIDVAACRPTRHSPVRIGIRRSIIKSGAGKILLSLKSDLEVSALARRANAELAAERTGQVRLDALRLEMEECRTNGYALSRRMIYRDMDSIAMHLPIPPGRPAISIAVGGQANRIHAQRARLVAVMERLIEPFRSAPPREGLRSSSGKQVHQNKASAVQSRSSDR